MTEKVTGTPIRYPSDLRQFWPGGGFSPDLMGVRPAKPLWGKAFQRTWPLQARQKSDFYGEPSDWLPMPRLSKLIETLEDYLEPKIGPWYERHKKKLPRYVAVGLIIWYFYGMVLNSIRLGTAATFHKAGDEVVGSIWVFNPFRNWFVLFTPFGLGATAVIALLVCLPALSSWRRFDVCSRPRSARSTAS